MSAQLIKTYHDDVLASFRNYKKLAERAIEQVSDEEFFATIDEEANSIALIVKHIAGNLRSRWTDLLSSDGEKPDRHRDTEFELIGDTRASLMKFWEDGWNVLFHSVEALAPDDFVRTVTIRGETHSVIEAINRQLTHYAYHVGQIVLLAKHFRSSEWKSLSVPKNRSADSIGTSRRPKQHAAGKRDWKPGWSSRRRRSKSRIRNYGITKLNCKKAARRRQPFRCRNRLI